MSNTGISNLYPALIAGAVDMVDEGSYGLPLMVDRSLEPLIAKQGVSVSVAVSPTLAATAYTPGSSFTATGITQTAATVTLNKSYCVPISLTDTELSLPAPELQKAYFAPMLEGILAQVNADIATCLATATTNTDITLGALNTFDYDDLISGKAALDAQKASAKDRFVVLPSVWYNSLLGDTSFKTQTMAADQNLIVNGVLGTRLGFGIAQNHALTSTGYAFQKGAVAFAARVYAQQVPGVQYSVINYKGIPIRIAAWNGDLALNIQADILYGVSLVKGGRTVEYKQYGS